MGSGGRSRIVEFLNWATFQSTHTHAHTHAHVVTVFVPFNGDRQRYRSGKMCAVPAWGFVSGFVGMSRIVLEIMIVYGATG